MYIIYTCRNPWVLKIISLFTCSVTITRSRFTWFHVFITNNAVLSRWTLPQFAAQSHLFISSRPRRRKRLPHCLTISPSATLNCDQFISAWEKERESPFLVLSSASKEGKSSTVYTLQRSFCNLCSFLLQQIPYNQFARKCGLPKGCGKEIIEILYLNWCCPCSSFTKNIYCLTYIFRSLPICIASYRSCLSWLFCNIILKLTRVLDNEITSFINRSNRIAYRRLR